MDVLQPLRKRFDLSIGRVLFLSFFFFYLVDVLVSVAVMSICPSVCPLADDVIHHKFIRQFFQVFLQDRSEN